METGAWPCCCRIDAATAQEGRRWGLITRLTVSMRTTAGTQPCRRHSTMKRIAELQRGQRRGASLTLWLARKAQTLSLDKAGSCRLQPASRKTVLGRQQATEKNGLDGGLGKRFMAEGGPG